MGVRLTFTRDLAASPAVVWPYIAEPRLIACWSPAEVVPVAAGDGGHPGGTGALRRVHVPTPAGPLPVDEVVEEADAPRLLAYRVFAGAPVRRHLGRIALDERWDGGTRLRWDVDLDFVAPGMAPFAERVLAPRIEEGLDALARRLRRPVAGRPPPPARNMDELDMLPGLFAAAEAVAEEQRALADRLAARDDDRQWFARVYQHVTLLLIAACRAGRFQHPAWVLRMIPRFHRYYVDNLRRRLGEAPGEVDHHWACALAATEAARQRGWPPGAAVVRVVYRPRTETFAAALESVHHGMRAHIEEDLPLTLAEVAVRHYRGRCDYARFRADYLRMAPLFAEAATRFAAHLPRRCWPWRARIADALVPTDLLGRLIEWDFYPIGRERRNAFERGARFARLLLREAAVEDRPG